MRRRLLKWLCSPCCRGSLSLRVIREDKEGLASRPCDDRFWHSQSLHRDPAGFWDESWSREITDGTLTCECGLRYPISHGIPRFHEAGLGRPGEVALPEAKSLMSAGSPGGDVTAACYSSLWRFKARRIGWGDRSDSHRFLGNMGLDAADAAGKTVLDAGCGDGHLTSALSTLGMEAIGLDLSAGVDIGYARNRSPLVHFVQADILNPPLRLASCDFVWSFGVLHHTRNTALAFRRCAELLRPGGRLFIWVYDKAPRNRSFLISATRRAPLCVKWMVSAGLALGNLAKKAVGRGNRVTWSQSIAEVLFWNLDMYGPEFRHVHRAPDVMRWFEECGFRNVSLKARMEYGFGLTGDLPNDI